MNVIGCRIIRLPIIYLLREQNNQSSEDADEVNEEVQRVRDKVLVAHATLLDNQLGVIQDKTAHEREADVEMHLIDKLRAKEEVSQREQHKRIQKSHQCAAHVNPAALLGKDRA